MQTKQERLDADKLRLLFKKQFQESEQWDIDAILNHLLSKNKTYDQAECAIIRFNIQNELKKIAPKSYFDCILHFNYALVVRDSKIQQQPIKGLAKLDVNSDFRQILGEEYYRKLTLYTSSEVQFDKAIENPYRKYDYFHWIENGFDIIVHEEIDSLHLKLLKLVWMFKFVEAINVCEKIISNNPYDEEVLTIIAGIKLFQETHEIVIDNEELKEIFLDRKHFQIQLVDYHTDKIQQKAFNQKINQVKQHLSFGANYFSFLHVQYKNIYYKAIALFLSNRGQDSSEVNRLICQINQLSIIDRFNYAKRFFSHSQFQNFKTKLIENIQNHKTLDYVLLFGTRVQSRIVLQNYLDETSDIQKVAMISVFLKLFGEQAKFSSKEDKNSFDTTWKHTYQQLLNMVDSGVSRHKFDQKCITIEVERKKKTLTSTFSLNCNNCKFSQTLFNITKTIKDSKQQQKITKGVNCFSKDMRSQIMLCFACTEYLPKCSVCLFPTTVFNGYAEELKKSSLASHKAKNRGQSLANSLVWCPKCFHGGHFGHIQKWLLKNEKKCPVFNCKCRCEL